MPVLPSPLSPSVPFPLPPSVPPSVPLVVSVPPSLPLVVVVVVIVVVIFLAEVDTAHVGVPSGATEASLKAHHRTNAFFGP